MKFYITHVRKDKDTAEAATLAQRIVPLARCVSILAGVRLKDGKRMSEESYGDLLAVMSELKDQITIEALRFAGEYVHEVKSGD